MRPTLDQVNLQESAISGEGVKMSRSDSIAVAEVFLILEKWQLETDLKLQKENRHLDQPRNPTESHQQG